MLFGERSRDLNKCSQYNGKIFQSLSYNFISIKQPSCTSFITLSQDSPAHQQEYSYPPQQLPCDLYQCLYICSHYKLAKHNCIEFLIFRPQLLNFVSLSKLARPSRSDLIVYSLTAFLEIRLAQSRERKCPISQTAGCSSSLSSRSRSSRRIWWLVMSGIKFERPLRRALPALLLK